MVLFERSGRSLIPTPAALEIAEHVRAMGEAATRLSLSASGQSQSIEGTVKISASEMYAALVLPGLVTTLRSMHPGILVEIIATNNLSDLRQREADIAIRNTEPKDPEMIARRLPDEQAGLFGVAELIETYGPFESPADLDGVPFIDIGTDGQFIAGMQAMGAPVSEANFVARTENHLVHWELAKSGIGIGVNGWDVGAQTPGMHRILDDHISFDFPVWLVAPRELKTSRRVRVVYDALAEHLKSFRAAMDADRNRVANSA